MSIRSVPAPGDNPEDVARRAQEDAATAANMVAEQVIHDYRDLVDRAGRAFDLTQVSPALRETLRTIHLQGVLALKGMR